MNFLKQYKDYMSISNNNIKTNTNLLSALKKSQFFAFKFVII